MTHIIVDENGAIGQFSQFVHAPSLLPYLTSESQAISIIDQELQLQQSSRFSCINTASFIYSATAILPPLPSYYTCYADSDCNGNGLCKNNMCVCYPNYDGADCSLTLAQIIKRRQIRSALLSYYLGCTYQPFSRKIRNVSYSLHQF